MKQVKARIARLERVAAQIEGYARSLAITLANFHGTNDFALTKPTLDNGYVLNEIQRDLIALVVVRTAALLSSADGSTDATLPLAAKIIGDRNVRDELIKRSRLWVGGDPLFADVNERAVRRALARFSKVLRSIKVKRLKKHRDWILAHSTTKKPPKILLKQVWRNAHAAVQAADHLLLLSLGRDPDLAGVATSRQEETLHFWRAISGSGTNKT